MAKVFQSRTCFLIFVVGFAAHIAAAGDPKDLPNQRCLKAVLERLQEETPGWRPTENHGPPEIWSFDGHDGAQYYDDDFKGLYRITQEQSISALLSRRKTSGKKNHVLDLFGSGFFVEDPKLADSVTGMRFGPFSRETNDDYLKSKIAQLPATPVEVLGDATNPKTWDALRASMKSRGIPSMDLVAMRPDGGWQRAPFAQTANQNALAVELMVENVLSILSRDGQFYFSVTIPQLKGDLKQHPALQSLVKRIENETGYHLFLATEITETGKTFKLSGVLHPK